MLKQTCGIGAVLAVGLALTLAGPAQAAPRNSPETPTEATIYVPDDFVTNLSDTRATGHYEVVGTGLHIWTEGKTSTDKVAEYVATSIPLANVGEPSLNYKDDANSEGDTPPGFQLVVDFDGDGHYMKRGVKDGILVGESSSYGNQWWLSFGAADWVKADAPHTGTAYKNMGTLQDWRNAFPNAQVRAFGFSLGSGVLGDGVLNSINFAGTEYTFAHGKNECKSGGWATSTASTFRNQGDCVSYSATTKNEKLGE